MAPSEDENQKLLVSRQNGDCDSDQGGRLLYNTFLSEETVATDETVPTSKITQTGAKAEAEADEKEYTWKTIVMIMSTWIGIFLAAADMSVMATLSSPITESFSAFQLLTWFINAYTISSALVQPLSGKLSDIYGRRNCLLWANFAFLVGNLLCGLSTKSWHFILGRAIAGLGGGCLHSISTFLASDVIPLRARAYWQGVSNVAFAVGFALGGSVGGVVSDAFGWQWAFLSQPAPIVVSMLFVWWLVPNSIDARYLKRPSIEQIDFLGSATLTLTILALMFGAVSGGNTLPWSHPLVYGSLLSFPFLLAAFIYVEDRIADDPVIPVRLLIRRSIAGCCLDNLLCTTANTAILYYLPMTMETKGLSPAQAGVRQASNAVGAFIGSVGAGIVMRRTGKYYWICLFAHLLLVGSSLTTLLTLDYITTWLPGAIFLVNGAGYGTTLVTTLLALISSVDHHQHAVVTSASYASRTVGNTLGTTIAGAIFQNIFAEQLWARLGDRKGADLLIPSIRRRQIDLATLPSDWREEILVSYDVGFRAVFTFVLAAYILASLAISIIRENQLHSTLSRK